MCVNFRLCSLVGYQKSLNWQRKEANMVEHIARILEKGTPTTALYRSSVKLYLHTTYIYTMNQLLSTYQNKK